MTTLITLGGILVLLGLGFWWAVDTGKRLNQAKSLRERVDKVANVNEFNRKEDEELIDKYKMQEIILAMCVHFGCVSEISGKELFPIHARPVLPKALVEPEKTFLKCGDDFYCITPENLEGLRIYLLSMQSLLNKYEHATEVLND